MKAVAFLGRYRSALLLLAALGFGALAMFGARGYIAKQIALERERLQPRRDEIEVIVAKRELRRGELVSSDTMAVRRIPREFVPGTAIAPDRFDSYVGARLNTGLRSGEPLLHATMDGVDAASFSTKVRQGIRALTVSVDEVNSMSGMMQPGDRIDLHFSARPALRPGGAPVAELTVPLLQDVLVLATGRQVRAGADEGLAGRGFTTITVEVSPDQAQRLIVAQRNGRLTALLRNRDDRAPVSQRPIDINSLFDLPAARVVAGRTGPEIIVGGRGPLAGPGLPMLGQAPMGAPLAPLSALQGALSGPAGAPAIAAAAGGDPAAFAAPLPVPGSPPRSAAASPIATPQSDAAKSTGSARR